MIFSWSLGLFSPTPAKPHKNLESSDALDRHITMLRAKPGEKTSGWWRVIFPVSAVPYIKFFPSDWLSEESLRLVSFAARGLWIDMLCLMAKNERRGYLEVNGGVNPTLPQLAKLVGSTEAEIAPLLDELKAAKTCSVDENGVLFSRRLVRDTESYNQAVSYGKKGGNPGLTGGVKGRVGKTVKATQQPSLGSGFCILDSSLNVDKVWVPVTLNTPDFASAWLDWRKHRAERRKPLKPGSLAETGQLKKLAEMGITRAVAAIRNSIANDYQGIFEPSVVNGGGPRAVQPASQPVRMNIVQVPPVAP